MAPDILYLWPPQPPPAGQPCRPAVPSTAPLPPAHVPLSGDQKVKPGSGSHTPPYALCVFRTPSPKYYSYRFASQEDPGGRHPPPASTTPHLLRATIMSKQAKANPKDLNRAGAWKFIVL